MSISKFDSKEISNLEARRDLPSWINCEKDEGNFGLKEDSGNRRKLKGKDKKELGDTSNHAESLPKARSFSKLLDGVIFALSGFVNPERSTLRSQALEMGAEFKPDWTSDCTLLICAFLNTPKFKQVEADCGTIVSKEWITECYNTKKLIEIDSYLMHAGKPWRKQIDSLNAMPEHGSHQSAHRQVNGKAALKPSLSATSKDSSAQENIFPSSEVKKWAISDLNNTISWLESQEEKPEPEEIKKIAAEGIITCLQDALDALQENKDIRHVMDQWMFVPRVVKEIAKVEHAGGRTKQVTKNELVRLAKMCRQIYTDEMNVSESSPVNKRAKRGAGNMDEHIQDNRPSDDTGSDSDATIVMTEEEIEQAWRGS